MRGLQVLVLEREPKFYGNARAVYTDGECMRIFQSFGMAHTLAADMLQDVPVQMVLPDGSVLMQIKNTQRPHGWPANNFFYQPSLETALADGLARYPERQGAARQGADAVRAGFERRGGLPRRDGRIGLLQGGARAGSPAATAARRGARARAVPGGRRRRAQRRAHPTGHPDGRQELPQPLAGGGPQAEGPGRRPAPPAVLQLHLRSGLARR